MWSKRGYDTLGKYSAYYDLAVTWPLATPWSLGVFWSLLGQLHAAMGWPPLPPLEPPFVMFTNFLGSVVLVWSAARVWSGQTALLTRYDAVARWAFSLWMLYGLAHGVSPLIWGVVAVELSWGLAQSLPLRRDHGARSRG